MADDSHTEQIVERAPPDVSEAKHVLEITLGIRLSSEVEQAIAQHLEQHGDLKHGDTAAIISLVVREAKLGIGQSPIPALVRTAIFLAFAHFVLPVLGLAINPLWLLLSAFPLFYLLRRLSVSRAGVRRALGRVAQPKELR